MTDADWENTENDLDGQIIYGRWESDTPPEPVDPERAHVFNEVGSVGGAGHERFAAVGRYDGLRLAIGRIERDLARQERRIYENGPIG